MGGEARHPLDTPLAELDSTRDAAIAAPAPSSKPPPSLSESAADGAGTSPAGPDAGAEALQPKRTGAPPKLSAEQKAKLNRDYLEARAANGDRPVRGWVTKKAAELGVSLQTIYRALDDTMIEILTDSVAKQERAPAAPHAADEQLPHTETPGCWCRRKRASRDNVWCKLRHLHGLRPAEKPATEERFKVRRVEGTRY